MKKASLVIPMIVCLVTMGAVGKGATGYDLERTADGKLTPTFVVKDVLDTGTLLLKVKGSTVRINLIGIKRDSSKMSVAFVKKLVSGKRVALISDKSLKDKGLYYVYPLDLDLTAFKPHTRYYAAADKGFLGLKVSFFGTVKGFLPNLNAALLRSGYVEVDRTYQFEHRACFEECEEEARTNGRGLWNSDNTIRNSTAVTSEIEGTRT